MGWFFIRETLKNEKRYIDEILRFSINCSIVFFCTVQRTSVSFALEDEGHLVSVEQALEAI